MAFLLAIRPTGRNFRAERARRQYDAVEPEHRLVAGALEQRWNTALEQVRDLEQRLSAVSARRERHSVADRATLRALAEECPRVWTHTATDARTKKRIVRLLVEEIIATAVPKPSP
ncbi:MAG: hypothetical protein Q8P98_06410 [Candidatus Rokubacteria bacterium]|nr:hypothetical protein [Candidatus Rokubacteria bacterium]